MKIPEVINHLRCYIDGSDEFIGASSVELPDISSMTSDVKGIGVAGTISTPIHGQFEDMELKVNWQIPTETALQYSGGRPIKLDLYSDVQGFDSSANDYTHDRYRTGASRTMRAAASSRGAHRAAVRPSGCTTTSSNMAGRRCARSTSTAIRQSSAGKTISPRCARISA